jgi:hypothetical protein
MRILLSLLIIGTVFPGCEQKHRNSQPSQESISSRLPSATENSAQATNVTFRDAGEAAVVRRVERFCGDCHAVPPADSFPKSAWQEQVDLGFQLYFQSGRSDLELPTPFEVTRFFEERAPDTLELPKSYPLQDLARQFQVKQFGSLPNQIASTPHIKWLKLPGRENPVMVYSDMRDGKVGAIDLATGADETLAKLRNASQFCQCDVDNDGFLDLVVADLGSMGPEDHQNGQVVWLRWNDQAGKFDVRTMRDSLGRVADVQAADFDQDGDLDFVCAEFGWRTSGSLFWLENLGEINSAADPRSQFAYHLIEFRHGPINVPVVDWDGDGDLDFLALIGQEHEEIVLYENAGKKQFHRRRLYFTPDPSYGSSGIELVDLDRDGDLDLLYANGDAFDVMIVKPYHGVRWLENVDGKLVMHELGFLPGAHRALPIDIDNDQDWDVVAVALLPDLKDGNTRYDFNSVLLFRNDGNQQFQAEAIEHGLSNKPTAIVGDFDQDGDSDFATGNYNSSRNMPRITVWYNNVEQVPTAR